MGHKVHPKIFRILGIQTWNSKWFSEKNYKKYLEQDIKMRKFLSEHLKKSMVGKIEIERSANNIKIIIYTARPGLIIGRGPGSRRIKEVNPEKVFR